MIQEYSKATKFLNYTMLDNRPIFSVAAIYLIQ